MLNGCSTFIKIFIYAKNLITQIFELNNTTTNKPPNNGEKSHFDFLDGYRGSLALLVVITHTVYDEMIANYSQSYSIAGFFMLSAFLLTHRLLDDLNNVKKTKHLHIHGQHHHHHHNLVLLVIVKYVIRRFFRVYVVYVLFYACAKYGPACVGGRGETWGGNIYAASVLDIACLRNPGHNHLWTIPAEIKFYFVIPIFCLIASAFDNLGIEIIIY